MSRRRTKLPACTGAIGLLVCVASLTPPMTRNADAQNPALERTGPEAAEEVRPDGKSRLRIFLDDTVLSPTLGPRVAFAAALDQHDSPEGWSGGAGAYGKRVAARAGLTLSQAGVQHGTAALLRLDPRRDPRRCECSHPLRRTAYALTRTFVTRDRRGREVPNAPLVAGAFGGALIATAWYPPTEGPGRDVVRVASLTLVGQAGANVFHEFSDDLKRIVRR